MTHEVFIETPSDLQMQSSMWNNYKHQSTAMFLIACTPNGAVCYISPLDVGSLSDVNSHRMLVIYCSEHEAIVLALHCQ